MRPQPGHPGRAPAAPLAEAPQKHWELPSWGPHAADRGVHPEANATWSLGTRPGGTGSPAPVITPHPCFASAPALTPVTAHLPAGSPRLIFTP